MRALCAPVVQVLDASLPGTLQEAQRPGGVAQGAGGSLWALQWGQAHGKKTLPKKLSESLESELEHEEQNYQPEEVGKRKDVYCHEAMGWLIWNAWEIGQYCDVKMEGLIR